MRTSRWLASPRRVVGFCGAACVVALLGTGTARADGPVQLRSRLGDICLDGPNPAWPAQVMINPCNGADSQRWTVTPDRRIENAAFPGQCLNMQEDAGSARLSPCWTGRRWTVGPDGHIAADLGGCLTMAYGAAPGSRVATRWCNDAPEQGWDSVP